MTKGVIQLASPVCPIRRNLVMVIGLFAGLMTSIAGQPVAEWWNGKYASGDWFGVRTNLEDHGVILGGSWKANYYGIADGGKQQRGAFDEQILFTLKLDLEKMLGITGLSLNGSVWYRDGKNVNIYAGASPAFNPSALQVGTGWRLLPIYAMWESRDLFPVKDMFTLVGGWTNPYYFFIQQPASQLFVNNAIFQTKGLVKGLREGRCDKPS